MVVAGSGHASIPPSGAMPAGTSGDVPRTPTSAPTASGAQEARPAGASIDAASAAVRRGGAPRSGRGAGEEGFEPQARSGRRRPSVQEVVGASPVRGAGRGHHPEPGHHRWSATNASPISQRNVLTHAGINIENGNDTPTANLQHHSSQHVSSRKIPAPDTTKGGRDARGLGHHVSVVGSELLRSNATGAPKPEAGHDAKPGRRQQRYDGHGHTIAHDMHPDGAGATSLPPALTPAAVSHFLLDAAWILTVARAALRCCLRSSLAAKARQWAGRPCDSVTPCSELQPSAARKHRGSPWVTAKAERRQTNCRQRAAYDGRFSKTFDSVSWAPHLSILHHLCSLIRSLRGRAGRGGRTGRCFMHQWHLRCEALVH